MRAMQINQAEQGPRLIPAELPKPEASFGEILVDVHAAGVAPMLCYPTTHTKSGTPRMRAVPGHEFSGVIAAIGKHVEDFEVGDVVYGMNDWFAGGGAAEFCITLPRNVAQKPATLSHKPAASVPIGTLVSWQGAIDRAKLEATRACIRPRSAGAVRLYAV